MPRMRISSKIINEGIFVCVNELEKKNKKHNDSSYGNIELHYI